MSEVIFLKPQIDYTSILMYYGVNDNSISIIFKVAKNDMAKEIDLIAKKYEIISEYKRTGEYPKFNEFHLIDSIVERNVEKYKISLYRAMLHLESKGDNKARYKLNRFLINIIKTR